ncbi:hypothetical protein BC941DRAFT_473082 [Chlamydoabsidia padenii]|nr:hypothetical protein BC941DRAFT_473082 [Chlamydoabsidia padenii]
MPYSINDNMILNNGPLSYYYGQDDYERRPSSSSTTSSNTSSSTKRSSSHFISRTTLRLSNFFTNRRRSIPNYTRFSLPVLINLDDPLSPKQMEIERLIEAYPEQTVRLIVTPEFAN